MGARLSAHLDFGFLNLALGFVKQAIFATFSISAKASRNQPDRFASFMLGALYEAGVSSICVNAARYTMQKALLATYRPPSARAGFVIDVDVCLHTSLILISLPGLVYFRIAPAVLILGRTRRINCLVSTIVPWRNDKPRSQ
jgi:hypothetical protein